MSLGTRSDLFTKIPRIYFDSGIAGALGRDTLLVYFAIRRYEQRDPYNARIEKLMKQGHIMSYVNQTTIAVHLGMSRSTVTRSVSVLVKVGWVAPVNMRNNGRAYRIGFDTDPDEEGRVRSIYWADRWLSSALAALPKRLQGWKHKHALARQRELASRLQAVIDDPNGARKVRHGAATLPDDDAVRRD